MDYKEQFRALLSQIEQDGQRGVIPMIISEVLAERYDGNVLRWCEYHIQQARQRQYKQILCEGENL